jgi:Mrp family chromosome partitioning ATPase
MDKASKNNFDRVLQDQAIQKSISSIKHKFLVMSSQGGVGKTSVIVNLAVALSIRGMKVGLIDANFHGPDIHRMLGLDPAIASYSDKSFIPAVYSDNLKVASIESVMEDQNEEGVWGKSPEISEILWFISSLNWGNLDYLFIDTPPGPGEGLLAMIRAIPEAKKIIVTAPNKVGRDSAKNMINFFRKEKLPIFGWIENMCGFLCQNCGVRQELFSSGSGSRAVFLGEISFLGRIPIEPHMDECVDVRKPSLEMYPKSEVAGGFNLIAEKLLGGNNAKLFESRSTYHDL